MLHIPPPRIESLRVQSYCALRDLTLEPITPLTVLRGPRGSGKCTVFDLFACMAEMPGVQDFRGEP